MNDPHMIPPSAGLQATAVDYVVDGPPTAAAVARGEAHLIGISLADDAGQPRWVTQDIAAVLGSLGDRPRLHHDAVFARAVEIRNGLPVAEAFDDTRVMARLLEEPEPSELARIPEVGERHAEAGSCAARSAQRIGHIRSLHKQLAPRIAAEGLAEVYRQMELPVTIPTAAMILNGVRVNTAVLEHTLASAEVQLEIARRQLHELAGREVNLDSDNAMRQYIYEDLALPATVLTPGGQPSTGDAALKRLAGLHGAVATIRLYKSLKPIRHAASSLLSHLQPRAQRVYPGLDPLGASTGRFSCSHPNLQALPGPVLEAIEADPGHLLLEADYSQMELRVLAHLSRDPRLMEAFRGDADLHRRTAAMVLGIPEDAVTPDQRKLGKVLNFSIIYGRSALGLAEELNISLDRANTLLVAYTAAYPGVAGWATAVQESAYASGEVRTLFGRRRHLPKICSSSPAEANEARRQAVNTIVQGTAADLLKLALIRLHGVLPSDVRMLLPVHDSVLLEVPTHLVEDVRDLVTLVMEAPPPDFNVPLKVDVTTGPTWAACKGVPTSAATYDAQSIRGARGTAHGQPVRH